MDKRSKIIIIILSIIIGLLVLGIVGYIVFSKVVSNKEKQLKTVEKSKTNTINNNDLTDTEKEIIKKQTDEYLSLSYSFPIRDVDDLSDQDILWFAATKIENFIEGFSEDTIEDIVDKYFKDDINVVYGDIDCPIGDGKLFKYDSTTEKYSRVGDHGHGGPSTPRGTIFYEQMEREKNHLKVYTKIVYGESCGGTCGPIMNYYTVPSFDKQNDSTKVFKLNDINDTNYKEEITLDEFNTIKDKVPYTIFTYDIDDDNYGLISVDIKDALT